jgi:hypothetical protein
LESDEHDFKVSLPIFYDVTLPLLFLSERAVCMGKILSYFKLWYVILYSKYIFWSSTYSEVFTVNKEDTNTLLEIAKTKC